RRLPSWLAMTVGSPPSTTATTELVVPRSMPITFAMFRVYPPVKGRAGARAGGRGANPLPPRRRLHHVDLDLLGLDLVGLGERDGQHAVAIAGLDVAGLDRDRQGQRPLELPEPPLAAVVALLLRLLRPPPLAPERQHVPGDGQVNVLLAET